MYNEYVNELLKLDEMDSYRQIKWLTNVRNYEQNKEDNERVLSYFKDAEYEAGKFDSLSIVLELKHIISNNAYFEFANIAVDLCLSDIISNGIISENALETAYMAYDAMQSELTDSYSIYSKEQREYRRHVGQIDNIKGNIDIASWLLELKDMTQDARINRIAAKKLMIKSNWSGEDTFRNSVSAYISKIDKKYEEALDLYVQLIISELARNKSIYDSEYKELEEYLNYCISKENKVKSF